MRSVPPVTLREQLLAVAGGCGSPTCRDPHCEVPHGRCHWPRCDNLATTAKQTGAVKRWVFGEPTIYCSLHNAAGRAAGFHAELYRMGLVPTSPAAKLLYRSPESVRQGRLVDLVRVEFGAFVRLGVNARDVVRLSSDKNARRVLSKPLAVLNGTEQLGAPLALSDAELAIVVELRARDPDNWGWRKLADRVNAERPADAKRVSHMTVKRAFERVTAPAVAP